MHITDLLSCSILMNLIQFVTDSITGRSSVGKRQPILPITCNKLICFSIDLQHQLYLKIKGYDQHVLFT